MSKKKSAPSSMFKAGDDRTRELARRGGQVRATERRVRAGLARYEGTVLDMMDTLGLEGESWRPWRAFISAIYALPMDDAMLAIYRQHTERETPPSVPVREAWMAVGRRGGKSQIAAIVAVHAAVSFNPVKLASGELTRIPVLAADREQARAIFNYAKGIVEHPEFKAYVVRDPLKDKIEFRSRTNIQIATGSYRTVRGFACPAILCDEISHWLTDDRSSNPDSEILSALRPSMLTVDGSILLGLSTPYAAKGELYSAYQRYWGKDDDYALFWNADTLSMHPNLPTRTIEIEFERDPVIAASEYGRDGRVEFRRDVEAFLDPEAIRAVTAPDRRELPPQTGIAYKAFADPSGGSQDSFTLAVAHMERDVGVLDCVRERRPPFSPDAVVQEYAALLRSYGLHEVTGDRYSGQWVVESFRKHGITYRHSERVKSEIYAELVAPVNAARVELLDLPVLRAQLVGLERRVSRAGKDSIDHAPGGRDDVANSAAGALTLLVTRTGKYDLIFG